MGLPDERHLVELALQCCELHVCELGGSAQVLLWRSLPWTACGVVTSTTGVPHLSATGKYSEYLQTLLRNVCVQF